jgi:tRNA(Arg) A34 adenosine deaminase TadA
VSEHEQAVMVERTQRLLQLATPTTEEEQGSFSILVSAATGEVEAIHRTHTLHPLHHSVMLCIQQVAEQEHRDTSNKRPHTEDADYLCKGLELYTTREPCVM